MNRERSPDAARASLNARTRWNQMRLGGRAMALLSAIDMMLAGQDKLEDRITNDQLKTLAGIKWNSDLEKLRKQIVAKGCIGYEASVGGHNAHGIGYGSTFFYLPEDRPGTP